MLRFSLFGIPIVVQPWFWITLAFLGGALRVDSADDFMRLLLFVVAGFVSILVHELGHALTGRHFGAPTQITLMAFGGLAAFPAQAFSRSQDFLVTAAGPAVQILLGLLLLGLSRIVELPSAHATFFVGALIFISIAWALLNLVPVLPLDGGRLLASLLGPHKRDLALKISMGTAIGVGLLLFLQSGNIIALIFLGFMAHQNWQELKMYPR